MLAERGLGSSQIGLLLGAGTFVRLISAPLAAQVADRFRKPRAVLLLSLAASAIVALAYWPAGGILLFAVSLMHAFVLAPIAPTADALALGERRSFDYGWVRGAGSAAFVAGTFLSGIAIDRFGLVSILPFNAGWLMLAVVCAALLPTPSADFQPTERTKAGDLHLLLRNRTFLLTVLTAALILASHAMHDAFAVIRWRAAGFSNSLVSALWSEAVVAEVVVFTVAGPWILKRLNPATCAALSAVAGMLRWIVVSQTLSPLLLGLVEPLHGLTFALLHLACMRIIAAIVPAGLATSAQAIYGVVAAGAATAIVTLASGPLYERFGGDAFLAMTALCLAALPIAFFLRRALLRIAPDAAIRDNPVRL